MGRHSVTPGAGHRGKISLGKTLNNSSANWESITSLVFTA